MGLRPTNIAFYYLLTFLISHLLNFLVKALLREKLQESVVTNLQRGFSPGARICGLSGFGVLLGACLDRTYTTSQMFEMLLALI